MAVAVVMTSNNPTTKAVIMFGIIVVVLTLTRFIQCDVQARTSRTRKESYYGMYVLEVVRSSRARAAGGGEMAGPIMVNHWPASQKT